jgi:hypothetical protein
MGERKRDSGGNHVNAHLVKLGDDKAAFVGTPAQISQMLNVVTRDGWLLTVTGASADQGRMRLTCRVGKPKRSIATQLALCTAILLTGSAALWWLEYWVIPATILISLIIIRRHRSNG